MNRDCFCFTVMKDRAHIYKPSWGFDKLTLALSVAYLFMGGNGQTESITAIWDVVTDKQAKLWLLGDSATSVMLLLCSLWLLQVDSQWQNLTH